MDNVQRLIQGKLAELNAIKDVSYLFTRAPASVPQVEWFQMTRRGGGWATVGQAIEMGRVECPCVSGEPVGRPAKDFATLARMKKYFGGFENLFTCVVEEHLAVPCTIWQLVVWNATAEQRDALVAHLSRDGRNGATHDYHTDMCWVSDIPPDVLAKWSKM